MISLIFVMLFLLTLYCSKKYVVTLRKCGDDNKIRRYSYLTVVSICLTVISFIAMTFSMVNVAAYNTIDDQIAIYESENENIENNIKLISLYPGLESSEEVLLEQKKLYNENQETIEYLKERKIDLSIYCWLLYFGSYR
jgi:heme/copper-type cytochrome/quinol oxidase subunit 2